jgi:hypothetical protein
MTLKSITIPKEPQVERIIVKRRSRAISRINASGSLDEDWSAPQDGDYYYDDPRMVTMTPAQRADIENKIAASVRYAVVQYSKQCWA